MKKLQIAFLAISVLFSVGRKGNAAATPQIVSAELSSKYADSEPSASSIGIGTGIFSSPRAGDLIIIEFDTPIIAPILSNLDQQLGLAPFDNTFGKGATLRVGDRPTELVVELGQSPKLNLVSTYQPGANPATPAQLAFENGPAVPILIAASERKVFVGEQFADSPSLSPFYGQLHAHSHFSDGKGTAAHAFKTARTRGLDFFAVTDHMEFLDLGFDHWGFLKRDAERANTDGSFVAFAGFEWSGFPFFDSKRGALWTNHLNFLGAPELFRLPSANLAQIYRRIGDLTSTSVATFNHPGYQRYLRWKVDNWNDFIYDAHADLNLKMIRVEGLDEVHSEAIGYIPALDRGWHLAPEVDEDTHCGKFVRSPQRVGTWSPALTRTDLLKSFHRMANFFTDRPGTWVKMVGDSKWLMGSTLYGPAAHTIEVSVGEKDSDEILVTKIELITFSGRVEQTALGGALPFKSQFTVNPSNDNYYYARVTLSTGQRLISAPLFIDR